MPTIIVPLKCPACGGILAPPKGDAPFGSEMACNYCGSNLLLIVDRNLMTRASLEASGGRICTACGRVARGEARFCQCRASLIRLCYWCYNEVPVDHACCDICGWLDPGYGVMPAIESRWQSLLALLPHKNLICYEKDDDKPVIDLFHSVWDDPTEGTRYHRKYEELLRSWRHIGEMPRVLRTAVFSPIGQPGIDFVTQQAMLTRADGAVTLLYELARSGNVNALAALLALTTVTDADGSLQEAAFKSLDDLAARRYDDLEAPEAIVAGAIHGLVGIATSPNVTAAARALEALAGSSYSTSNLLYLLPLKQAYHRTIRVRAKELLRRARGSDN